jgi:XTP/dITP diphosphohydrolase
MKPKIVLATRNPGKISEIEEMIKGIGLEILTLDDFQAIPEPPEEGNSFEENALSKAKAVHQATGIPALADDSGIEVEALNWGPGVRSARYGGTGLSDADRSQKLLENMASIPDDKRAARFRCVMVLFPSPGEEEALITEGVFYGQIAREPAGDNGFGYDPIFYVPENKKMVAEMSEKEKNKISHRYRALVEMKRLIVKAYDLEPHDEE